MASKSRRALDQALSRLRKELVRHEDQIYDALDEIDNLVLTVERIQDRIDAIEGEER